MKYNALRIDKGIDRLIFVEGASDSRFYASTSIDELSKNSKYIYQSYEEGGGGKEAVFYAYNGIKTNQDLKNDMNRCIFIVDRDWELSIMSKDGLISGKDRDRFTLTQGHSMECYFLEYENLQVIFSELGIIENLEDFKRLINDFKIKTHHYWALKGTIQYANKHSISVHYRKKNNGESIFNYNFKNPEYFETDLMNEEISLMEKALKNKSDLVKYCNIWDKKILEEPRFIRGHDYYDFLTSYIEQVCGKKISAHILYKFVPHFSIAMEIK